MYSYKYITIHSNTNNDNYIEFFFLDKDGNKALACDFEMNKDKHIVYKESVRVYEYSTKRRHHLPWEEAIKIIEYWEFAIVFYSPTRDIISYSDFLSFSYSPFILNTLTFQCSFFHSEKEMWNISTFCSIDIGTYLIYRSHQEITKTLLENKFGSNNRPRCCGLYLSKIGDKCEKLFIKYLIKHRLEWHKNRSVASFDFTVRVGDRKLKIDAKNWNKNSTFYGMCEHYDIIALVNHTTGAIAFLNSKDAIKCTGDKVNRNLYIFKNKDLFYSLN